MAAVRNALTVSSASASASASASPGGTRFALPRVVRYAVLWFLVAALPGCVVSQGGTATIVNRSHANDLEIALEPLDCDDSFAFGAVLDAGEQVTTTLPAGGHDLLLIDTAGYGCVIRSFYFFGETEELAEITDWDLVECAGEPSFPDDPFEPF